MPIFADVVSEAIVHFIESPKLYNSFNSEFQSLVSKANQNIKSGLPDYLFFNEFFLLNPYSKIIDALIGTNYFTIDNAGTFSRRISKGIPSTPNTDKLSKILDEFNRYSISYKNSNDLYQSLSSFLSYSNFEKAFYPILVSPELQKLGWIGSEYNPTSDISVQNANLVYNLLNFYDTVSLGKINVPTNEIVIQESNVLKDPYSLQYKIPELYPSGNSPNPEGIQTYTFFATNEAIDGLKKMGIPFFTLDEYQKNEQIIHDSLSKTLPSISVINAPPIVQKPVQLPPPQTSSSLPIQFVPYTFANPEEEFNFSNPIVKTQVEKTNTPATPPAKPAWLIPVAVVGGALLLFNKNG